MEENLLDEIISQTAAEAPSPAPAETPAGLAEEDMASLLAQKSVDEMSEEERANLDLTGTAVQSKAPPPAGPEESPAQASSDDLLSLLEEQPAQAAPATTDALLGMLEEQPAQAQVRELRAVQDDAAATGAGIEDPALAAITGTGDEIPSRSVQEPVMPQDQSSANGGPGEDALDALLSGAADGDPLDELLKSDAAPGAPPAPQPGLAAAPAPMPAAQEPEEDDSSDPLDHLLAQNEDAADHPSDEPLSFEAEIVSNVEKVPGETLDDLIGKDAPPDKEEVVVDILTGSRDEKDAEVALRDVSGSDGSVTNLIRVLDEETSLTGVQEPKPPVKETFREEVKDPDESFVQLLSEVTGRKISDTELEEEAADDGIVTLDQLIKDAEETLKQSHARVISEAFRLEQTGRLLYEGPDREEVRKAVEERVLAGKGDGLKLSRVVTREVVKVETETKVIPIRVSVDLGD